MLAQFGETVYAKKKYQWVERFQNGRTSVTDEYHSGCLTTSWMLDNIEQVNDVVKDDGLLSLI